MCITVSYSGYFVLTIMFYFLFCFVFTLINWKTYSMNFEPSLLWTQIKIDLLRRRYQTIINCSYTFYVTRWRNSLIQKKGDPRIIFYSHLPLKHKRGNDHLKIWRFCASTSSEWCISWFFLICNLQTLFLVITYL